jgi:hypothetical protein
LRVLCKACHKKRRAPLIRITKESDPEKWAKVHPQQRGLWRRALALEPLLLCDDEKRWDSIRKDLMRERRDAATGQGGLFELFPPTGRIRRHRSQRQKPKE